MTRPIAVLRPEPGNAATVARIEAAGRTAIRLPIFAVAPVDWTIPDPAEFDALVLTSANAVRHAGPGLARLAALPVLAVGEATAHAAERAGLTVTAIGTGDATALGALATARAIVRALHLTGADHRALPAGVIARTIPVYRTEPLSPDLSALAGATALVHSPAAGAWLSALMDQQRLDRSTITLATISAAAADACGTGWRAIHIAPTPREAPLLATALALGD